MKVARSVHVCKRTVHMRTFVAAYCRPQQLSRPTTGLRLWMCRDRLHGRLHVACTEVRKYGSTEVRKYGSTSGSTFVLPYNIIVHARVLGHVQYNVVPGIIQQLFIKTDTFVPSKVDTKVCVRTYKCWHASSKLRLSCYDHHVFLDINET